MDCFLMKKYFPPLLLFCFLCPILCSFLSIVYCSLTLSAHHCVLHDIFLLNEKDQLNGLVISHLSLRFFGTGSYYVAPVSLELVR